MALLKHEPQADLSSPPGIIVIVGMHIVISIMQELEISVTFIGNGGIVAI